MPLPTVAVASDVSKALKADESELKDAEMLPAVAVEGEAATHVPEAQKAVAVEEAATHVDIEAQEKDESKVDAEEDAVADAAEATEAKPKRRAGPAALRSRVLAELAKSSAEDVRRRLEAELVEHDQRIAAAQAIEDEKQKLVDEAAAEVAAMGRCVEEATQVEAKAIQEVKDLRQKKKDAAKLSALKRKELQSYEDMLVLLDLEKEKYRKQQEAQESFKDEEDAKRQKIEELLRVVEETKKAQEELKKRAKDARQQMRDLEKEQRKLARMGPRLGPFSRRQAAATKASDSKSSAVEFNESPPVQAEKCTEGVEIVSVKQEICAMPSPFAALSGGFKADEVITLEDSQ